MTAGRIKQLTRRYQAALRKHAAAGTGDGLTDAALKAAERLGNQASQLELGVVKLAQVHVSAWETIAAPDDSVDEEMVCRGDCFFRQALISLATASDADCPDGSGKRDKPLTACAGMVAADDRVKMETDRRKAAEEALKESIRHHDQLLAESNRMQEQLRHLSHQILMAQEEERKRISRELHDEISQVLTSINVRLATLKVQSAANTGDLEQKITKTQRLVENSVNAIHRFARELRPAMLDDLGLIPALLAYIKEFEKRTGLRTKLSPTREKKLERLSSLERTVLYRIAQESLKNVAKHAKASLATVSLKIKSDVVHMLITDNGKSFNVNRVYGPRQRKRLGIIGMRERAEMVGGDLTIESVKGKGTTIRVNIPLRTDSSE